MTSADGLVILLEDLGWRLDLDGILETIFSDDANAAFDDFRTLAGNISSAIDAVQDLAEAIGDGDVPARDVLALVADFRNIIAQLQGLVGTSAGDLAPDLDLDLTPVWQSFTEELPEYLISRYLSVSQPKLYETMLVLGVIEEKTVSPPPPAEGTPGALRTRYLRRDIRWDYLGDLVSDPMTHLAQVYRWGGAAKPDDPNAGFDALRFLASLRRFLAAFGLRGRIEPLSPRSVERFLGPDPVPEGERLPQYALPITRLRQGSAFAHFGLEVAPVPEVPGEAVENILLTHETFGGYAQTMQLREGIYLTLKGAVDASQQLNLLIRPGGADVIIDNGATYDVGIGLSAAPPGGFTLLGGEGGTRIGLDSLGLSFGFGGSAGGMADLSAQMRIKGFVVALTPGEGDGLLNSLLGDNGLAARMDLTLSYDLEGGFLVDGSGGITAQIPIDQNIGPLNAGNRRAHLVCNRRSGAGAAAQAFDR